MAATAIAALSLTVAIPINASLTDPVSFYGVVETGAEIPMEQSADSEKAAQTDDSTLGHDDVADLRELPLLPADSVVREKFQTMADTQDHDRVEEVGALLASRAGINEDLYFALESALPEVRYSDSGNYPYRLPELEALLSDALTPKNAETHTEELLELASFSALRAAWAPRDPQDSGSERQGWISYTILEALPESCDRDLSIAHLATLGQSRILESIDPTIKRAIESCPTDPTPSLLYGTWLADMAADVEAYGWHARPWNAAITYFDEWQENDRSSSLARAGAAHAMLRLITAADSTGTMPLTARELRSMAAEQISAAIELNPHPAHFAVKAVVSEVAGDPAGADHALQQAGTVPQSQFARSYLNHSRGEFSQVREITPGYSSINPLQLAAPGVWLGSLLPVSPLAITTVIHDPGLHDIGAGSMDWFGAIPEFRGSYDHLYQCPVAWSRWNALLAGNYAEVRREAGVDGQNLHVLGCDEWMSIEYEQLEFIAAGASYGSTTPYYYNFWQNYHRMARDLAGAESVIERWAADIPNSSLALTLRGEISFLRGDFDEAVKDFETVLAGWPAGGYSEDSEFLCRSQVLLSLGVALGESATRSSDAAGVIKTAGDMSEDEGCEALGGVDAYISMRVATDYAKKGGREDAILYYEEAIGLIEDEGAGSDAGAQVLKALIHQTYAAWLVEWGNDPDRAIELTLEAISFDPLNAVFWDTLGQAHQQAGNLKAAEDAYEMATRTNATDSSHQEDPTAQSADEHDSSSEPSKAAAKSVTPFQSLNNLAVLRLDRGDRVGAAEALAAALQEKPDYAIGWWNLGVLESGSMDSAHFNRAEGALSQAVRLDQSFRGKALDLVVDYEIFDANLDLSKSVDQSWSIGSSARPIGKHLSWVAIALAGLAVVGSFLQEQTITITSEWVLKRRSSKTLFVPVVLYGALLAGLVVFTIESSASGWVAGGLVAMAMAAIVTLYTVLAGPFAKVRGWTPAVAVSVILIALRIPFLPAPVVNNPEGASRRWPGVMVMAGTAAASLLMSLWTGSPTLRLIGLSALALTASALLPLPPFDGAIMKHRAIKATTSVALLGTAVAASMAWI